MIEMYGIPNCDTIKKARKWLESSGVEYVFHDYKKEGADATLLKAWCDEVDDWEKLLNRRGTTWRKLSDEDKEGVDEAKAIALMVQNPSLIKRPVLLAGEHVVVGFSAAEYAELFG